MGKTTKLSESDRLMLCDKYNKVKSIYAVYKHYDIPNYVLTLLGVDKSIEYTYTESDFSKVNHFESSILDMYSKGIKAYNIAIELELNYMLVIFILIKSNCTVDIIEVKTSKVMQQDFFKDFIIKECNRLRNRDKVKELYGVSVNYMTKIRKEKGEERYKRTYKKVKKADILEDTIIKMYRSNRSIQSIAKELNTNPQSVSVILKDKGFEIKCNSTGITKKEKDAIVKGIYDTLQNNKHARDMFIQTYKEFRNVSHLAVHLGVSACTVHKCFKICNFNVKEYEAKEKEKIAKEIIKLYKEGMLMTRIARQLNISNSYVVDTVYKAGYRS